MRRSVAAVEARRSRSPDVADDVALMEGRVGKEGGAESLIGYPSEECLAGSHLQLSGTNRWGRLVIP
jgi:hypothetical protein